MKETAENLLSRYFRRRTIRQLYFDLIRIKTRILNRKSNITPEQRKLHLGCGKRIIDNWLNSDVRSSQHNVDLAGRHLPWADNSFDTAVCQHVIDDLEMTHELIPILKELQRVLANNGELWLACPDLEKLCQAFLDDRCQSLVAGRQRRFPDYTLNGYPSTQFFNDLVYEKGVNINFFDFELLKFVLVEKAGFKSCERTSEKEMLQRFPDFPERNDDEQSLYVRAVVQK